MTKLIPVKSNTPEGKEGWTVLDDKSKEISTMFGSFDSEESASKAIKAFEEYVISAENNAYMMGANDGNPIDFECGYDYGYEVGYKKGYKRGYNEGYDEGYGMASLCL